MELNGVHVKQFKEGDTFGELSSLGTFESEATFIAEGLVEAILLDVQQLSNSFNFGSFYLFI